MPRMNSQQARKLGAKGGTAPDRTPQRRQEAIMTLMREIDPDKRMDYAERIETAVEMRRIHLAYLQDASEIIRSERNVRSEWGGFDAGV